MVYKFSKTIQKELDVAIERLENMFPRVNTKYLYKLNYNCPSCKVDFKRDENNAISQIGGIHFISDSVISFIYCLCQECKAAGKKDVSYEYINSKIKEFVEEESKREINQLNPFGRKKLVYDEFDKIRLQERIYDLKKKNAQYKIDTKIVEYYNDKCCGCNGEMIDSNEKVGKCGAVNTYFDRQNKVIFPYFACEICSLKITNYINYMQDEKEYKLILQNTSDYFQEMLYKK